MRINTRIGGLGRAVSVVLSLMLISSALIPLMAMASPSASDGVAVASDATGDHVGDAGGASDIVRLGMITDADDLKIFIGVAGSDHSKLIQYGVEFTINGLDYVAFTSYQTDGQLVSSFLYDVAADSYSPITASWSGLTLDLVVARSDIGSPTDGDAVSDVFAYARHGASGITFDTTSIVTYRIGNLYQPEIDPITDQTVVADDTVTFTVVATDGDGDVVTLDATGDLLAEGATFDALTGEFAWTPGEIHAGDWTVTFTATDGASEPVSLDVLITVVLGNAAPVFDAINDMTAFALDTVEFTVTATDADGDDVTITAITLPAGATFDAETGEFEWVTELSDVGIHSVEFEASDGELTDTLSFTIEIVDQPTPTLDAIADQTVKQGALLTFTLTATYTGARDLVFSADVLPDGATLDEVTGEFAWTPSYSQLGGFGIDFTVNPEDLPDHSDTITVAIDVLEQDPVTLNPVSHKFVLQGTTVGYTLVATYDGLEDVVFSSDDLPAGATLDETTGAFSWTPGFDQLGDFAITFTAMPEGAPELADSKVGTITVLKDNGPPTIEPAIGDRVVGHSALIELTLTATDPENDVLTWSAMGLPSAATLDSATGEFSWQTAIGDDGDHVITFRVSDGSSYDEEIVTFTVVNNAPVLNPIGDRVHPHSLTRNIFVAASDPDGDPVTRSVTGMPAGATFAPQFGRFTWTPSPSQVGDHVVTFSASDGAKTTSEMITITVTNDAPTISSISPQVVVAGRTVSATFTVSDVNKDSFVVSIQDPEPGMAVTSTSFTWETGLDQAGVYDVVLVATDSLGASSQRIVKVTVNANQAPTIVASVAESVDVFAPLDLSASGSFDPDGTHADKAMFLTYEWTIGDDVLEGETVAISFEETGPVAITLTVTDEDGVASTQDFEVLVQDIIRTDVTLQDPSRVGDDGSFVFPVPLMDIEGVVIVTDDLDELVAEGIFTVTVKYRGSRLLTTGETLEENVYGFEDGVGTFSVGKDLFDVAHRPGYYDIVVTAYADSRLEGVDTRTSTSIVTVWVGYGGPL